LNWLTTHWELIFIAFGILVNLAGVVYNICKFYRAGHNKGAAIWLCVLEAAREYEKEAEAFTHYTSAEKLQYVLSRLRVFTAELGAPFDEERLTEQISADIAFTKAVNASAREELD
jgi:hypothetical protein